MIFFKRRNRTRDDRTPNVQSPMGSNTIVPRSEVAALEAAVKANLARAEHLRDQRWLAAQRTSLR